MLVPLSFVLTALFRLPLSQTPWKLERPIEGRETGTFADARVTESSGVAASRRQPGVLWTHNDSGDDPFVYATDTTGAALGRFRVTGARNVDWEDLSLGPCGATACLYLADTGDNGERRSSVKVYRFPEPTLPASRSRQVRDTEPAQAIEVRYPDGAHDVEAMWVGPAGDVHLLSKGRAGPVGHYRVAGSAWTAKRPVTADWVQRLPIAAQSRLDRVTGAGLSPDGRLVAVRTFATVYFFIAGSGRLELPPNPVACDVRTLGVQGEGVSWLDDHRLVLTSERFVLAAGSIAVARCPLPLRVANR